MRKTLLTAILSCLAIIVSAQNVLTGFDYQNNPKAPTGDEWQNPEQLALNKLQPSAYMFHFATADEALQVLGEKSSYYQSLDGIWKFHWTAGPSERPKKFYRTDYDVASWDDIEVPGCWNVQGLGRDGSMKYGVPIYVNQPVIFYHERKVDDWKKGIMRPAPDKWTVSKYPNEVGSYRRTFTIPTTWDGRRIIINFDGVDSFFYLWINGHYIGFSKNSRNTASFDITDYVKKAGENIVAVEVYRSSDASLLESQDMFRLPGIIRSTYLTSVPETHITDLSIHTLDLGSQSPVQPAKIQVDIKASPGANNAKYLFQYKVYSLKLYSDELEGHNINSFQQTAQASSVMNIGVPKWWSAEEPNRYVLVASLCDENEKVIDCVSTYFGICKVEIRDTKASDDEFGLAGRYFYVNNQPVKLKGVNRHETNPSRGHAITREQMLKEVFLMKQGNINHVRLSHYNNDPYFYYLANKYGLYLEDECNIESHQYYYGDASLSHPEEWKAAHVARNMEMVHAHVNHPSIVIWSLGNEAGPGKNFVAAYNAIKQFDKSRPVQYERNNDIVDMGSNQYPSVDWVRGAVKGKYNIKYPFHISEYAHSMGNAVGNLADYWTAIESTNYFCGGAIWDWVDQAIDTYTKDGVHYLGYGGDHGDWPNDGMFCMNGIMLPDLNPKPQYFEVKKVYQNVGVKAVDMKKGVFEVFNKNYFTSLSDYAIVCRLMCDGEEVEGTRWQTDVSSVGPRQSVHFAFPLNYSKLSASSEYFLNVEFCLTSDKPWAKAGYVQMEEQLPVKPASKKHLLASYDKKALILTYDGGETAKVAGKGFEIVFDNKSGTINTFTYKGQAFITPGNGPLLDAYRAPVDNDNWCREAWFQNGLHNLAHHVISTPVIAKRADGRVTLSYTVLSQGKESGTLQYRPGASGNPYEGVKAGKQMTEEDFHFTSNIIYTVYPDGSVELMSSIVSSNASLALPRLGYQLKLTKNFNNYTYYGRGPVNNYNDRCSSQFIGLYKSTVQEQFVNFPKPQSMGNREAVRWCALTDSEGNGLQFVCLTDSMSASALPWSAMQMTLAQHPYQLPESDATYLHLDAKVNGLGGNSCGQGGPLSHDRVTGAVHHIGFVISPVSKTVSMSSQAMVRTSTPMPVSIIRDLAGKVTIVGEEGKPVVYSVDSKTQNYSVPFDFKQGGTVCAWYKDNAASKVMATFTKIEKVPVIVVSCSSQEDGEGAERLLDGNPSTIWHTMYSITVTKHPHWIDFDCGEEKLIKGFTYLARQDGPNGDVKGYKVELSNDGKTWGEPVSEGNLANTKKEQKILFEKPIRARYLRFTALSAHNGQDFASGAEFSVLAE